MIKFEQTETETHFIITGRIQLAKSVKISKKDFVVSRLSDNEDRQQAAREVFDLGRDQIKRKLSQEIFKPVLPAIQMVEDKLFRSPNRKPIRWNLGFDRTTQKEISNRLRDHFSDVGTEFRLLKHRIGDGRILDEFTE
jgi:hypothetical protein